MRNDIREDYERLIGRIAVGKNNSEEIKNMIERLDAVVEAWVASAEMSKRAVERFNSEAKEYCLLRDLLKEKIE